MVNSFWFRKSTRLSPASIQGQCILCAASGQPGLDICQACEAELPFLGPSCISCALPINRLDESYCGQCLHSPPSYTRTEAIWEYHPPIAQLISAYKYNRQLSYGNVLFKISASKFASAYFNVSMPDFITPVPLHWRRRLVRGFNQSELLAQHLSCQLSIPLKYCLKRAKTTPSQQSLDANARKQNLKGAFLVSEDVTNKTIVVVDDVMTTGATAEKISQCLLKAGAKEVHIWCLARTPH